MTNKKTLIVLIIITTICTLLLAGVEVIFRKASVIFERRLYAVILDIFEISYNENNVEEIFQSKFKVKTLGKNKIYINNDNHVTLLKGSGPGLWSRIEILLAINADQSSLYALHVLMQAETPGLGGRIAEKEFQDQFKNIEIRPELILRKLAQKPNEVNAISGATKTCDALEMIINKTIREFDNLMTQEKANE